MSIYACSLCSSFAATSYLPVLSHIGRVHTFGPNRVIQCGIDGCPATYGTNKYQSFRSHVYRKHRLALHSEQTRSSLEDDIESQYCNNGIDDDNDTVVNPLQNAAPFTDNTFMTQEEQMKRSAALFQLKTLEESRITQSALTHIIADVQILWDEALSQIQKQIDHRKLSINIKDDLPIQFTQPFHGLKSEYQQHQYYKENFNLIVSVLNYIIVQYYLLIIGTRGENARN